MLEEVLPEYGDKFKLKRTLASGPMGMLRTMKLGIHSVPALLIGEAIAFRGVPEKQSLINRLNEEI